jgi:hypothetical protein
MGKKRKFYRTTYKVVILSEGEYGKASLYRIHYDITEGSCSGEVKRVSSKALTPRKMAKALMEQGSDPEFFMLDENGNEIE